MLCRRHPKEQKEDVPCSRVACYVGGILRSSRKMSHAHTGSRVACYVGGILRSRRKMSHAHMHWVQGCILCRRHPKEQKEDVPCSRVACYVGGILRSRRKMSHAHTGSRFACIAGGSRRKMSMLQGCMLCRRRPKE